MQQQKQSCDSAGEPAKLVWKSGAACSRPDAQGSVTRRAEALGAEMLLLLGVLSLFVCVEEFGRFCLMKFGEEMPVLEWVKC